MRNITDYIQLALVRKPFSSQRQLAKAMELSHPGVMSTWITRGVLPTDENMLKLAEFAGIDEKEALTDLAIWRAEAQEDSKAADTWRQIQATVKKASAAVILLGALSVPLEGKANTAATLAHKDSPILYIMRVLYVSAKLKCHP